MTDFADADTAERASGPADIDQIKQLRERAARLGCRLRKRRGEYLLSDKDDEGGGTGFENLEDAAAEIGRRERGDPITITTPCGIPLYTHDPKTGQTTNHLGEQIDPAEGRASWRDHLPVHPAANLFQPMSKDELRELGEDIKANGLVSSIVLYKGKLLDGRNRLDAMELVGERLDRSRIKSLSNQLGESIDPYAFVVSANLHRRHLNVEQRQELLITLIARQPERSDRQIAKMVGVDHKTIAAARTKGEDVGSIPHVETRTDSRGRKQPATKTKTTKPKPVDHRVTESPEISLEQRRAENAELDLSAEERAAKASPDDRKNHGGAGRRQEPSDDAESDDVVDAATIEEGALHELSRITDLARMFRKFFKLSSFDREAEARISTAIDRMIKKWRLAQATLTNERRGARAARPIRRPPVRQN